MNAIVTSLDRSYPQLEESSGLLLKLKHNLSGLEILQQQKIGIILSQIKLPFFFGKNITKPLAFLVFSLFVFALLWFSPKLQTSNLQLGKLKVMMPLVKENVPGSVAAFEVEITPPSYTRHPKRLQNQFYLRVERAAMVKWNISTTKRIESLSLIYNSSKKFKMKPLNAARTEWFFDKKIMESGFYQLELDEVKSELYQIESIPDLPVRIDIKSPKPRTIIDVGQVQSVVLNVKLVDDYGVKGAFIAATLASGKGEGVSFTERKLPFDFNFKSQKDVTLNKVINLKSLGMKPGDELYFYVSATDNNNQQSRSDAYSVSIVDTTELMSLAGMSNGVNLVPEYFRSQRQIIIDTEKLLKEQAVILDKVFKDRSNEIGIDQKLLRLRYGKFLGEESENEIGADHGLKDADHDHKDGDHEEKTNDNEKFGDVKGIMDQYAHKHDVAEDATFFEPELKAQLKAVLTEMWGSELRLRTYKPQEALPYEYKALRLLKDLQQKSRAYVAKTSVKTSQLKLEKRLTGELDKILSPILSVDLEGGNDAEMKLRQSLAILDSKKSGLILSAKHLDILRNTEARLITSASVNPKLFLPALKTLRKILMDQSSTAYEISGIQQAILKMIPKGRMQPTIEKGSTGSSLYKSYYRNLKAGS